MPSGRARQARRRTDTPVVAHVRVEGIPDAEALIIVADLEARHAGKALDRVLLDDSILRISGTDRYEMSGYALRQRAEGTELVVGITPKSYGPRSCCPPSGRHHPVAGGVSDLSIPR